MEYDNCLIIILLLQEVTIIFAKLISWRCKSNFLVCFYLEIDGQKFAVYLTLVSSDINTRIEKYLYYIARTFTKIEPCQTALPRSGCSLNLTVSGRLQFFLSIAFRSLTMRKSSPASGASLLDIFNINGIQTHNINKIIKFLAGCRSCNYIIRDRIILWRRWKLQHLLTILRILKPDTPAHWIRN